MSTKYDVCTISGKRIIRNKRLAERRMEFANQINGSDQIKNVYKCPHCSGWHLTKMSKNEHSKHIRKMINSSNQTGSMDEVIAKRIEFLKTKNKIR